MLCHSGFIPDLFGKIKFLRYAGIIRELLIVNIRFKGCLEILSQVLENISPLLRITHISRRRSFLFLDSRYDLIDIDIFIGCEVFLVDHIRDFLTGKFFILCGFRDEALICRSTDVKREILFKGISLGNLAIDIFEEAYIRIGLILLVFIVADKIHFIDEEEYQDDKDISEVACHKGKLAKK